MKSNPCFHCQLKNQDKNNPICVHCNKRLDYVRRLERELDFALTHSEEKPAFPRLPTLSGMMYGLSVVSDEH